MSQQASVHVVSRPSIPGVWSIRESQVSTNDWLRFDTFASLANSHVLKQSDGSDVTHTRSGNTITITQASLVRERVLILVWGVQA